MRRSLLSCWLLIGLLGLAVSAANGAPGPAAGCAPGAGLHYICGPQASEDLVRIPHTNWLIASGMNVGAPAHLYLIDTAHKISSILYPLAAAGAPATAPSGPCSGPPDPARMSMDGLALRPGPDGLHTLYAANHGDRMAIEFFAIDAREAQPKLRWTGCAPLPAGTLPNAVTTLPDGGLLVISFYDPNDAAAWTRMAAGQDTGRILEWHATRGFEAVPGSATSGGNGIETSADGAVIYASSWSSRQLVILSRRDGSRRAIRLNFMPDNLHRQADGSLLVAGQRTTVAAIRACTGAQCPQPWVVARVQPDTGRVQPLLSGRGSTAVNYACGAVALNGTVYLTVRGAQRIAYKTFAGAAAAMLK
jgi:hypothetical protein